MRRAKHPPRWWEDAYPPCWGRPTGEFPCDYELLDILRGYFRRQFDGNPYPRAVYPRMWEEAIDLMHHLRGWGPGAAERKHDMFGFAPGGRPSVRWYFDRALEGLSGAELHKVEMRFYVPADYPTGEPPGRFFTGPKRLQHLVGYARVGFCDMPTADVVVTPAHEPDALPVRIWRVYCHQCQEEKRGKPPASGS